MPFVSTPSTCECMQAYLVAGAAMRPISRILATQIGCSVGMGKMCFTKKVLSSTTCQTTMKRLTDTSRIHEQLGSNQRVCDHDSRMGRRFISQCKTDDNRDFELKSVKYNWFVTKIYRML